MSDQASVFRSRSAVASLVIFFTRGSSDRAECDLCTVRRCGLIKLTVGHRLSPEVGRRVLGMSGICVLTTREQRGGNALCQMQSEIANLYSQNF